MTDAVLDPRSEKAVELALGAKWNEALDLNLQLAEDYPQDIDTLNRLGRAYSETGNLSKAKASYQEVLKLDPYNSIAANNLKRLSTMKASDVKNNAAGAVDLNVFLEEPGKTKVIDLDDLAMENILVNLRTGDPVSLNSKNSDVVIISRDGKRVGRIQADWSEKIAEAIFLGSEFSAVIKAVAIKKPPAVSIFVKETKHSNKLSQPIFPTDGNNFTPYVREEALGILSNQGPIQTEADEAIEEVEVKDIPTGNFESHETKSSDENEPSYEED